MTDPAQIIHCYPLPLPIVAGDQALCGHVRQGAPMYHEEPGQKCAVCVDLDAQRKKVHDDAKG